MICPLLTELEESEENEWEKGMDGGMYGWVKGSLNTVISNKNDTSHTLQCRRDKSSENYHEGV